MTAGRRKMGQRRRRASGGRLRPPFRLAAPQVGQFAPRALDGRQLTRRQIGEEMAGTTFLKPPPDEAVEIEQRLDCTAVLRSQLGVAAQPTHILRSRAQAVAQRPELSSETPQALGKKLLFHKDRPLHTAGMVPSRSIPRLATAEVPPRAPAATK